MALHRRIPQKFGVNIAQKLDAAKKLLGLTDTTTATPRKIYGIPMGRQLTSEEHKLFEQKRQLAAKAADSYISKKLGGHERLWYYGLEDKDVRQLAEIALVEAIMTRSHDKPLNFDAWATRVMQNSITDWIRQYGWRIMRISRSFIKSHERLLTLRDKLEERLGREPTIGEIAKNAGMLEGKVRRYIEGIGQAPMEELLNIKARKDVQPEKIRQFLDTVEEAIDRSAIKDETKARQKNAFGMAINGVQFRKIGAKLGVTESRITQLMNMTAALVRANPRLADEFEELVGQPIPKRNRPRVMDK